MLQLLERTYISVFRRYPMLLRMALVVLLAEIVFAVVNNYALTLYIWHDLGQPMHVACDIIAVFLGAEMLLKFPAGHLSDRYGRRRFAAIGLAVCIGTPLAVCVIPPRLIAYPAAPLLLYLLLGPLRFTDGAGSAALWPPLFASVPDHVDRRHRGVAMSVMNTAYLAGLALGPALAGGAMKLSTAAGHPEWSGRSPFALVVLLALLASWVAWALPAQQTHGEESRPGGALPPLRVIAVILVITFSDMFATATLAPIIPPYLIQMFGVEKSNVGLLMLLLMIPAGILGMPIGHLTDRWDRRRVVLAALCITAAGLWGVSLAQTLPQALGAGALVMLGFMFGLPAWLSLITELAPEAGYGKVMGVMAAAQGAGAFAGPPVAGRLWGLSPHYPFYLAASMLTLSSLVALIFVQRGRGARAEVAMGSEAARGL